MRLRHEILRYFLCVRLSALGPSDFIALTVSLEVSVVFVKAHISANVDTVVALQMRRLVSLVSLQTHNVEPCSYERAVA